MPKFSVISKGDNNIFLSRDDWNILMFHFSVE